jgi:ribonuclease Z
VKYARATAFVCAAFLTISAGLPGAVAADLGEAMFKRGMARNVHRNLQAERPDGLHAGLCGTGSPMSDTTRKGPCTFVIAGKSLFVVDMGAGAARNFAPMGVRPGATTALFLTHYHSDHIDGLGDFLIQRWANGGAKTPLPVYGPEGVGEVLGALNAAFSFDRDYRIAEHGDAAMPASGFGGDPRAFAIGAGGADVVWEKDGLKVTAFNVDHGKIHPAVGYRFDYKGRSVVISGDTAASQNLAKNAAGADVLIHEALNEEMVDAMGAEFAKDGRDRLKIIFEEIKAIHTSPVAAAEIASAAKVEMLVFSHIIPPVPSSMIEGYFMKGAAERFGGKIVMGKDGLLISLPAGSDAISVKSVM